MPWNLVLGTALAAEPVLPPAETLDRALVEVVSGPRAEICASGVKLATAWLAEHDVSTTAAAVVPVSPADPWAKEAIDLACTQDPAWRDLSARLAPLFAPRLPGLLEKVRETITTDAPAEPPAKPAAPSDAERQRLCRLGYLSGDACD